MGLPWFFSVPTGKCSDSAFKYAANNFNLLKLNVAEFDSMQQMEVVRAL